MSAAAQGHGNRERITISGQQVSGARSGEITGRRPAGANVVHFAREHPGPTVIAFSAAAVVIGLVAQHELSANHNIVVRPQSNDLSGLSVNPSQLKPGQAEVDQALTVDRGNIVYVENVNGELVRVPAIPGLLQVPVGLDGHILKTDASGNIIKTADGNFPLVKGFVYVGEETNSFGLAKDEFAGIASPNGLVETQESALPTFSVALRPQVIDTIVRAQLGDAATGDSFAAALPFAADANSLDNPAQFTFIVGDLYPSQDNNWHVSFRSDKPLTIQDAGVVVMANGTEGTIHVALIDNETGKYVIDRNTGKISTMQNGQTIQAGTQYGLIFEDSNGNQTPMDLHDVAGQYFATGDPSFSPLNAGVTYVEPYVGDGNEFFPTNVEQSIINTPGFHKLVSTDPYGREVDTYIYTYDNHMTTFPDGRPVTTDQNRMVVIPTQIPGLKTVEVFDQSHNLIEIEYANPQTGDIVGYFDPSYGDPTGDSQNGYGAIVFSNPAAYNHLVSAIKGDVTGENPLGYEQGGNWYLGSLETTGYSQLDGDLVRWGNWLLVPPPLAL